MNGSPNNTVPHTDVTGAIRNIRLFTAVMPIRPTSSQYNPYPPKVASTISQVMANQKCPDAGGTALPVASASPVKMTAEVPQWMASARNGGAGTRDRRSRTVEATSPSIPANGIRYAQAGACEAASDQLTRTTPTSPSTSPAHCRPVAATPRSGPASAAATSGCTPSMSAVVPVLTPSPMAQ
ncbi:hypothetical protein GCM10027360_64680 [Amycolatopsis echigonensis]